MFMICHAKMFVDMALGLWTSAKETESLIRDSKGPTPSEWRYQKYRKREEEKEKERRRERRMKRHPNQ